MVRELHPVSTGFREQQKIAVNCTLAHHIKIMSPGFLS